MNYWQLINEDIFEGKYDVVYIGIGCGMGRYTEVNESNNQQCPCFLNKFETKLIVLFDPELEKPLKTESVLYELVTVGETQNYRLLKNENTTIYAMNESLYYELEHVDEKYRTKTESDIPALYNMISLCISNKIKFIMQDYTGRDSQNFYTTLFSLFDKAELLNYIFCDVTEKDCGCFIELKPTQAPLFNNVFIQDKYMKLIDMVNFDSQIKSRVDKLKYPLAWCYIKYSEHPDFQMFGYNDIKFLCLVYEIDYNNENENEKNRAYIIEKLGELIKRMIEDIVMVKTGKLELSKYLLEVINNRNVFNKTLTDLFFNKII